MSDPEIWNFFFQSQGTCILCPRKVTSKVSFFFPLMTLGVRLMPKSRRTQILIGARMRTDSASTSHKGMQYKITVFIDLEKFSREQKKIILHDSHGWVDPESLTG